MDIMKFSDIEDKIITLRNQSVLLDSDVAAHYEVQTKEINQAVRNNVDKFPDSSYVFELQSTEKQEVVKNFDHLEKLKSILP